MQNHQREEDEAEPARHRNLAQGRDQHRVPSHLRELNRDPQWDPEKMDHCNEERVRARPDERRPGIGPEPIPVFRRADVPKRVVFRRTSVDLFGVNEPELERAERDEAQNEAVSLPKLAYHAAAGTMGAILSHARPSRKRPDWARSAKEWPR